MGELNKKHNRKIWRPCPVCGGRVIVAHRNISWWVYCEENRAHIPQKYFYHAYEAIDFWNNKANKQMNADRIRSMSDEELAHTLWLTAKGGIIGQRSEDEWLDWLRQESE